MRRLGKCLCILAALSFFVSSPSTAGEVWRITSLDWPPYSDSTVALQGKSIEKLRDLLKREGIDLIVEFYPWARSQEIARQEGYVGYYPAWPQEVAEGFTASSPVDWSEVGVLTYKHSGLEWTSLEALFDEKVSLVSSYEYPENIARMAQAKPQNVASTPNELSLLKMLSAKRFKAAITDPAVMLCLAEREGIDNIKTLKTLDRVALVVAFRDSPDNLKRLELLERILRQ